MRRQYLLLSLLPIGMGLPECRRAGRLEDGVYEGRTRSIYTSEEYYGHVKIEIKKHKIAAVDFYVTDDLHGERFDGGYGPKHFADNPLFLKQCAADWAGIQVYPKRLLDAQELEGVDAIAGATWSYNLFRDAAAAALEKAR